MYRVGTLLRKAREEAGIPINNVAKILHVKPHVIEAIEKNDFSVFKSPTYVKGLIKNYCRVVDLDYQKILPFLRRELQGEDIVIPKKFTPIQAKTIQIGFVHLAIAGIVFLIVVSIFFIIRAYLQSIKPPRLEIIEPKQHEFVTDRQELVVKGITEDRVSVKVNGEQVPLTEDFLFEKKIVLTPGENKINIEAEKTYVKDKKTNIVLTVVYKPVKELTENSGAKSVENVSFKVKVQGGAAWILVRADNKQYDVGIKNSGYSKTFEASEYFEVITGKPSYTEVIFNGKTLKWQTEGNRIYVRCEASNNWQCE